MKQFRFFFLVLVMIHMALIGHTMMFPSDYPETDAKTMIFLTFGLLTYSSFWVLVDAKIHMDITKSEFIRERYQKRQMYASVFITICIIAMFVSIMLV